MALGVYSEVGKLRRVMVHRPGLEHSRLTPSTAEELLFDDVLWVAQAKREHDAFCEAMRERGVEVFEAEELFTEALDLPATKDWVCDHILNERQIGIGDPFADRVTPLLDGISLPPSEGHGGHYSLDVDLHRAALTGAGFIRFEPHLFRRERVIDLAALRALYGSYSYVRALPDRQRDELLDAIVALGRRDFGDRVPNVVLSALYLAANPTD